MTTGTDLTLAIRDGIHPKAIIYVKPVNGFSGVGDYYQGPQREWLIKLLVLILAEITGLSQDGRLLER